MSVNQKKMNTIYSIILFIILFVNIPPAYITDNFNRIRVIYNFLQIILGSVILIVYIKKRKISKMMIAIIGFYITYIMSTFLHKGNYEMLLKYFISAFSLCAGIELFLKYNKELLVKIVLLYFEFLIYINFITIILFPDGLYETTNINPYYFLGHRNNSIEYILPAVYFSLLYSNVIKQKWTKRTFFLLLISVLTVVQTWSANAIIALAIVLVYSVFSTKKIVGKFIKFKGFFVVSVGMFFSFVIFRIQYLFSWFIVNVLHKSIDFTLRTNIWDKALYYIEKSPIIGYGFEDSIVKEQKIGHPNSAHNYYLDFLYSGGIILLVMFLYMIFLLDKALRKTNDKVLENIAIGTCAGYFLIGFATPVHITSIVLMFMVFIMIYNFKYIKKENQGGNNE